MEKIMKIETNEFGRRMRARRNQLDLTLRELATKLGNTGASYLGDLETGRTNPSVIKAIEIAHALSVSVGWLLGETEDMDADKCLSSMYKDDAFYGLMLNTHVFPNGLTYKQMEEKLEKLAKLEKLLKED